MPEQLILDPLKKALASLEEALAEPLEGRLAKNIRDSVIQRFEYTYQLSWKTLKRALFMYFGHDEDIIRDIFRRGHETGLIGDIEAWLAFHAARNLTTHTYNEKRAEEVYETARAFLPRAQSLCKALEALAA